MWDTQLQGGSEGGDEKQKKTQGVNKNWRYFRLSKGGKQWRSGERTNLIVDKN